MILEKVIGESLEDVFNEDKLFDESIKVYKEEKNKEDSDFNEIYKLIYMANCHNIGIL